jgi:hypothetical protein
VNRPVAKSLRAPRAHASSGGAGKLGEVTSLDETRLLPRLSYAARAGRGQASFGGPGRRGRLVSKAWRVFERRRVARLGPRCMRILGKKRTKALKQ